MDGISGGGGEKDWLGMGQGCSVLLLLQLLLLLQPAALCFFKLLLLYPRTHPRPSISFSQSYSVMLYPMVLTVLDTDGQQRLSQRPDLSAA